MQNRGYAEVLASLEAALESAELIKSTNELEISISFKRCLCAEEYFRAVDALKAVMPECKVTVSCINAASLYESLPQKEKTKLISVSWGQLSPLMRPVLKNAKWVESKDGYNVFISEKMFELSKHYNGLAELDSFLHNVYNSKQIITMYADESIDEQIYSNISFAASNKTPKKSVLERQSAAATKISKPSENRGQKPGAKTSVSKENIVFGMPKNSKLIPMKEVGEETATLTVRGEVIATDVRDRRDGGAILLFNLTDKTTTLYIKMFLKKEERSVIDKIEKIKKQREWLTVHGRYQRDEYLNAFVVFPDWAYKEPPLHRMDNAETKRVELHLHTKMSSMDALVNVEDAINTAARWGHKAVAITDHGVVQAFPNAVKAAERIQKSGKDFKVILGLEGYLVPDCEFVSKENDFCAVAAVMGGLNDTAAFAIAAVRKNANGETKRFYTLVNPAIPLQNVQKERINATQEELTQAPLMQDAIKKLAEFANGAVISVFDKSLLAAFLMRKSQDTELENACIDVSQLTHYLFRDIKEITLENTVLKLNINQKTITVQDEAEAVLAITETLFTEAAKTGATSLMKVLAKEPEHVKGKRTNHHIILLAKNHEGLKNLYRLVSYSHMEHLYKVPRIPKSLLSLHRNGLIVGSACEAGELFCEMLAGADWEKLKRIASEYDYLEIQPIGNNAFMVRNEQVKDESALRELNKTIVRLGEELNIPVVATGDVHFLEPEDAIYRAILMSARDFKDAEQQAPLYLKTTEEMLSEFSYLGEGKAKEVVVDNPNAIANACDNLKAFLSEKGTYAPSFDGANDELTKMSYDKAHEIYGETLPEIVDKRLQKELNSIIGNGYATLYLLAQRLVSKSNADGYLVGSRGSVGSSFVATMAGITEVNPLQPHYVCPSCKHSDFDIDRTKYACGVDMPDAPCPVCKTQYSKLGYDIPFEVFLGFKGDKTPDIDLNFSGVYQPVAHAYVEEMFGEGHAFRAGTISGLKDKTVFGYVKGYCEQYNVAINRPEAERLVKGCCGVKRTTGQHPGGIVIVPWENDVIEFSPIQYPADNKEKNTITTHFDFHAMDDRLVKLDILGHDDPTALKLLNDISGLNPQTIPLDDKQTMEIFRSLDSLKTITGEPVNLDALKCDVGCIAIPEFGTQFVRGMIMETRPTTMEELVRISGLSHGEMLWVGNAKDLIAEGTATLPQVPCTRDDILNYLIMCGGDPSMSFKTMESVRKGKGLNEEMENAMRAVSIPEWYIGSCKKIKYMFPRAHAAAYVMMAFRVAYYKVHMPLAFYAVYFTVRADAFEYEYAKGGAERVLKNIKTFKAKEKLETKEENLLVILEVVYEMNMRGIELLDIDLYKSKAKDFQIEGNAIRPPFSSIQGVGAAAAEGIADAASGGEYISIEDFRNRTRANSAVISTLKALGCFDGMPESNQMTLFS